MDYKAHHLQPGGSMTMLAGNDGFYFQDTSGSISRILSPRQIDRKIPAGVPSPILEQVSGEALRLLGLVSNRLLTASELDRTAASRGRLETLGMTVRGCFTGIRLKRPLDCGLLSGIRHGLGLLTFEAFCPKDKPNAIFIVIDNTSYTLPSSPLLQWQIGTGGRTFQNMHIDKWLNYLLAPVGYLSLLETLNHRKAFILASRQPDRPDLAYAQLLLKDDSPCIRAKVATSCTSVFKLQQVPYLHTAKGHLSGFQKENLKILGDLKEPVRAEFTTIQAFYSGPNITQEFWIIG
ncbi:hypothetical protein L345_03207, partial [Ophiophagus hannah]